MMIPGRKAAAAADMVHLRRVCQVVVLLRLFVQVVPPATERGKVGAPIGRGQESRPFQDELAGPNECHCGASPARGRRGPVHTQSNRKFIKVLI